MKNKNVRIEIKLLFLFFVTFLEFVYSSGCIHQYFLAGKEWMRGVGNLQFNKGVFLSILPFHGFLGWSRRTAQETIPVTHIFKNNEQIDSMSHLYEAATSVESSLHSLYSLCF